MNALSCPIVLPLHRLFNSPVGELFFRESSAPQPSQEISGFGFNRKTLNSTSRISGLCLALLLGLAPITIAQPLPLELPRTVGQVSAFAGGQGIHPFPVNQDAVTENVDPAFSNAIPSSGQDPLKSEFPVPWAWIWEMQAQATATNRASSYQYRSPEVISPDGQLRAYTVIELEAQPDALKSQVRSTLLVFPLNASAPWRYASSMHLGTGGANQTAAKQPGTISILMPIGWSKDGEKLLVRQFEALMGSDIASDYGVIWSRDRQTITSWAPNPINYDSAVLLGWDQTQPGQILFETSILGELDTRRVAVDLGSGKTALTPNHEPVSHGQVSRREAGPLQS